MYISNEKNYICGSVNKHVLRGMWMEKGVKLGITQTVYLYCIFCCTRIVYQNEVREIEKN